MGDRSDVCLQEFIKELDNGICNFVTDEWQGFFRLLPQDRHFFGKDLTIPIEATKSDIRHRLARSIDDQKSLPEVWQWSTLLSISSIISNQNKTFFTSSIQSYLSLVRCLRIRNTIPRITFTPITP